jgi:hypothetical protein
MSANGSAAGNSVSSAVIRVRVVDVIARRRQIVRSELVIETADDNVPI